MPGLGIGNGIPFKNLNMFPYYYGAIRPCLGTLSFWQGLNLYDSNTVENKVEGGSDVATGGNCKYYNGVDSYSTITDNIILYIDSASIMYSNDGVIWFLDNGETSERINITNQELKLGFEFDGYLADFVAKRNGESILKFTLAEGEVSISENYSKTGDLESQRQFPFEEFHELLYFDQNKNF